MKTLIFAAVSAGMALMALGPAQAAQGCGAGWHRGAYGHCRPNAAPAVRVGPVVIGTYYPHRGWWDGRQYWAHRDRWHGGWRYR
jgi:hypothetical protein